jgi:hypothetical protein
VTINQRNIHAYVYSLYRRATEENLLLAKEVFKNESMKFTLIPPVPDISQEK